MTDSDKSSPLCILKRDGRNRVRSTQAQRQEVLRQFERSGLSGPAFCRVVGVNYQTFVGWRKEARRLSELPPAELVAAAEPMTNAVRFVEASLPRSLIPADNSLEIRLPGGASLTISDGAQALLAAQLIKALNPSSSC